MIISIKKICKLCIYNIITLTILYSHIGNAQNITDTNKKIFKEKTISILPNIQLTNFLEEKVYLKDINKNKLLLINFWATWCSPCLKEMPDLKNLSNELTPFDIKIIYLNQDNFKNLNKISAFLEKIKIEKNNVFIDHKMELAKKFKLRGLPTTLVVNKSGKILWRVEGIINWQNKDIKNWLKSIN